MKILAGLLILAASLQSCNIWASATATTAVAAAAAAAATATTTGHGTSTSHSSSTATASSSSSSSTTTSSGTTTSVATATASAVATSTTYNAPSGHIICDCERTYKPVCCSDGKTYSNDCIRRCISAHRVENNFEPIHFKSHGVCPDMPCNCFPGGKPVCGSDGHTYGNDCYFRCENNRRKELCLDPIHVAHQGFCRVPTCICPKAIIPVCGTDGRTYRNICVLQCVSRYNKAHCKPGIRVKCEGPCEKENCICPLVVDPLCCSDGNTYHNLCHVHCENRKRYQLGKDPLVVQHKGHCVNCPCPKIYDPVCASNGQTFANTCTLNCENKRRKEKKLCELTKVSHGVCPCMCTLDYNPVCGTDDKTYPNECKLRCENKRRCDLGITLIGIANYGRCKCRCGHCTRRYEPVCGTDGRTYWNHCWLKCNRDCSHDDGQRPCFKCHGPC
ncbi:hypothetical protein PYW08_015119 [Mythimna loreyi]|uniref:Uncharacterized protein n=1 Tax=Mythimna loreyi TaxID=667449 RepID=A0ACC2QVV5_9NEOP|nr:hypothetical protein PYW08_015119 [Mythimna loreyi]